jgi:hypothetical protein
MSKYGGSNKFSSKYGEFRKKIPIKSRFSGNKEKNNNNQTRTKG